MQRLIARAANDANALCILGIAFTGAGRCSAYDDLKFLGAGHMHATKGENEEGCALCF
jgi:hypothetical protein